MKWIFRFLVLLLFVATCAYPKPKKKNASAQTQQVLPAAPQTVSLETKLKQDRENYYKLYGGQCEKGSSSFQKASSVIIWIYSSVEGKPLKAETNVYATIPKELEQKIRDTLNKKSETFQRCWSAETKVIGDFRTVTYEISTERKLSAVSNQGGLSAEQDKCLQEVLSNALLELSTDIINYAVIRYIVTRPAQLEEPEVRGSIAKQDIVLTVRKNIADVRNCYEQALTGWPELKGRVAIKFIINPIGTVQNGMVATSTLGHKNVECCILNRLMQWRFPAPTGGGIVVITYPFVLQQATSVGKVISPDIKK